MQPTHSAIIVPIPEAEPAVAAHRDRLDHTASWGIPARVTVLYPFLPPADIVPHLTIGHDHPTADLQTAAADVQTAAADVQTHLPIRARATAVRLIAGRPEPGTHWTPLADLPPG